MKQLADNKIKTVDIKFGTHEAFLESLEHVKRISDRYWIQNL